MANYLDEKLESKIILEALNSKLKDELRLHFAKQAEPVIEDMVKKVMVDLQTGIQMYRNPMHLHDTVNIILTDKREKK